MTVLKSKSIIRKLTITAAVLIFGGLLAVSLLHNRGASAATTITNLPAQPAALAYSVDPADESLAAAYEHSGGLVVAGRDNYQDQVFKDVSAAGGTVLIYLNTIVDNSVGPYHDMLVNASACGPAIARWPGLTAMANQWGYLNDFRVGGVEQGKLECVLEKMVADNPHMAGWFADDVGSRSWYDGYAPPGQPKSVTSQYDWSKWSAANKQAYRDGAIALTQTFRKVANKYGLIFIVNGTWGGGSIPSTGGGYPDASQHGNALADGGFVEHHDGEQSYFLPYACSTQWAAQSPVTNGKAIMYDISLSDADRNIYANSGCFSYASSQSDYDIPQAPWTSFHATGLPTNTSGGISMPPDTTAPTVSITAPIDGVTVSGSSVGLTATASDSVGVSGVQFKLNGNNLGNEVTASPYGYTWDTTTLGDGTYVLTATARDAAGNIATSSGVNVTVNNSTPPPPDTTAPTVSVTAPADGSTVSGSNVAVTATASDNVGVAGVQFQLNGNNLGSEYTTGPYAYTWDVSTLGVGTYVLTAIAHDAAGNITTSVPVNVTVDNTIPPPDTTPPTVSITAPAAASTVSGNAVAIAATASDNVAVSGVLFQVDGANIGAEVTASPYAATWDTTTLTNGTHSLAAIARDSAGNTTTSAIVSVTVDNIPPDTTAPAVNITAPISNATVSGSSVAVNATATDNVAVSGVQFKLDGANLGTEDTTSPYTTTWNTTTVTNGVHVLTATARDAAGNTKTSANVSVNVNNDITAPNVSITAPAANATVSGSAVAVTATASDNVGVAGVQLKLNGNNIGTEDTASPYTYAWNTTTLGNGTYVLTATARDAAGNTKTSASVTVTVNNDVTAPTVSLTAPAANATVSGSSVAVNATATDNVAVSGVQFKLDGANLGTEDTTSPYSTTWNTTTVSNGAHSLSAVARDAAGNTKTSTTVSVTVNNASAQSPYGGTARAITSTIQAEDFDNGGEGVAYHDTTAGNSGGKYRTVNSNVDIESDATGYDVGYTAVGEWLEYTVNTTAATYSLNVRVATTSTSTLTFKLDGVTLASVAIPNTGSWNTWKTVTVKNINITTGNNRILRLEYPSNSVDTDWVSFTKQ